MRAFTSTLFLALVFSSPTWAAREVVDRVVAVIETDIITWRELEEKAAPFLEQLARIEDPKVKAQRQRELYAQVLDIEIGERIVEKELSQNRERLGVTEQDVDRAVEEVLRMNNLTREQLQSALYGQGMTWSEYRKKLREQIERARLIQFRVQGKVQVKDADVSRVCEERKGKGGETEVCASHLLLTVPEGASAADVEKLRLRASQLQSELSSGADFAAYALKYSDDKNAPDGKLGCFGKGEMVAAFEAAAFALKPGEVSAVVKTPFGFHIIKVTERRQAATAECDEAALTAIKNQLYQEELERQMGAWIAELRKKAFVEVYL